MDDSSKDELAAVLAKAGLSGLLETFVEEKVNVDLIPLLLQADLEKLGVTHVGERVMLMNIANARQKVECVSSEVKSLFRSNVPQGRSSSSGLQEYDCSTSGESLLVRADRLCNELKRPGKEITKKDGSTAKPCSRRYVKQLKPKQKTLVVIDQGDDLTDEYISLAESHKIYNGCLRYNSEMNESQIRNEIARLLRQKRILTHDLSNVNPEDFDFVRCANRKVRCIDGDVPFDASGINQVYKNGSVYVRFNINFALNDHTFVVEDEKDLEISNESLSYSKQTSIEVESEPTLLTSSTLLSSTYSNPDNFASYSKKEVLLSDSGSSDDELLQAALKMSRQTAERTSPNADIKTIADVVGKLQEKVNHTSNDFQIIVRRAHVLEDALQYLLQYFFNPWNPIRVEFVGEDGVDTGGVKREFFHLMSYHTSIMYIDSTGCFNHNSLALQAGVYFCLGQLVSMSLVYGGSAVRLFSPSVYSFLSGMNPSDIIVGIEEVADENIKDVLKKISIVETVDELQSIALENLDLISACGFMKLPCHLVMSDKASIVQSISLQVVILKSMAELQQFKDGMETFGVATTIKQYKELLSDFFVKKPVIMSADDVERLLCMP